MATNQQPIDRFTPVHFVSGFMLEKWGVSAKNMMIIAIAWELFERHTKTAKPEWFPDSSPDSVINSTVDIAMTVAGFWAADYTS